MDYLKDELYRRVAYDPSVFDFIQEAALDGLWYWDLVNPKNEWMNAKFWRVLGYDNQDFQGNTPSAWLSILFEEDRDRLETSLAKHLLQPDSQFDEILRFRHRQGRTVWIKCRGMILRDEAGVPFRMLGAHIDVTELKEREFILEACNEQAKIGFWELDLGKKEVSWSSVTRRIHEVSPEYIPNLEEAIFFYEPGDNRGRILTVLDRAINFGEKYEGKFTILTALGNRKWVQQTGIPEIVDGRCIRLYGTFQDITEQEQQFFDLHKTKEIFENAIIGTNLGTWEWNIKTGERSYNERWAQMIGYSLAELGETNVGTWAALVHPEDLVRSNDQIQKCFRRELDYYEVELRIQHKKGHWIWVYDRGKVFQWDAQGNPEWMIGTHQEITHKKKVEEQVRISEQMFRGIFENSGTGMALLDAQGNWTRMNRTLELLLGYSTEELQVLSLPTLTHADDVEECHRVFHEFTEQKRDFYQGTKRYRHKTKGYLHVILALSAVRDSYGQLIFLIAQFIDISEWRQTQHQLSESLKKLQDVLDASTEVGIVETDLDGKIQIFNRGAENLLGYSANEVLGVLTPALFHTQEEIENRALACFEKTGKWPETFQDFMADIANGNPERSQRMFIRKDGTTFPVQLDISGIMENETCRGFLGIATDISYIKGAEREITQLLQITQDQNARLKNFAHIVSHNLRSHASGIAMLLDLLVQDFAQIAVSDTYDHMLRASQNLMGTITHLSEVVDAQFIDKANLSPMRVFDAVERCKDSLLPFAHSSQVDIWNEIPKDLIVQALPAYLDSIVFNFISNAIKYKGVHPNSFVRISGEVKGKFSVIVFEDNGLGIDLERHGSKLFGMYKTFHTHQESKGVGLFITKNQIESLGGKVEVTSVVNQGSTFKVFLPNGTN